VAVWLQRCKPAFAALPAAYAPAIVCDVQRRCSCSCRLWRYISVMLLPFYLYRQSGDVLFRLAAHLGRHISRWSTNVKCSLHFETPSKFCPSTYTRRPQRVEWWRLAIKVSAFQTESATKTTSCTLLVIKRSERSRHDPLETMTVELTGTNYVSYNLCLC